MTQKTTFDRATKLLADIPDGVEQALASALNRAVTEGRTKGVDSVYKEHTLLKREIRSTFTTKRATKRRLQATLTSAAGPMPLSKYAHRPKTDTTGKNRRPVKVAVRRGPYKSIDRGFVHAGQLRHREGASRYPIKVKYGPPVPLLVGDEEVVEDILQTIESSVEKRLEHETLRLLNRW